MASDNQSSNSILASKEIISRILQAKNPKNFSEISDRDLQSSDTKNMIRHGQLYTDLLDVYVDDIRQTLENKRKLKEQFYGVCESILTFTCAIFFVVIILMLTGVVPVSHVSVLIGTFVSFLTVFIVVPHTIAKYLFNTDEEKYMTDIIKSIQVHDAKIRKGMRE